MNTTSILRPRYNKLHKYFINLDNRLDRLAYTRSQVGDDFIRVPAIDARLLDYDEIDEVWDMSRCQDSYRITQYKSQIGATLSQYKVFKLISEDSSLKDDDFVLIAEDDNYYTINFKDKLEQVLTVLEQPRFENIDLVILKYMEIKEEIDYVEDIAYAQKIPTLDYSVVPGINLDKANSLKLYYWPYFIRTHDTSIAKFSFTGEHIIHELDGLQSNYRLNKENFISKTDNPQPHIQQNPQYFRGTDFKLFVPYLLRAYSASLFLIRKRTCKRIVRKYPRPWWYADDFRALIPQQNTLICSPFLGYEPTNQINSSITNDDVILLWKLNKVSNFKTDTRIKILKWLKFISNWQISTNRLKRKISKFFQKILGLDY